MGYGKAGEHREELTQGGVRGGATPVVPTGRGKARQTAVSTSSGYIIV